LKIITYISRHFLTRFSSTVRGKRFWRTPICDVACPPQTFTIKSIPKLLVFFLSLISCSLSSIFILSCSSFNIISIRLFRSGHVLIDNGKLSCHFRACLSHLPNKQGFYLCNDFTTEIILNTRALHFYYKITEIYFLILNI